MAICDAAKRQHSNSTEHSVLLRCITTSRLHSTLVLGLGWCGYITTCRFQTTSGLGWSWHDVDRCAIGEASDESIDGQQRCQRSMIGQISSNIEQIHTGYE